MGQIGSDVAGPIGETDVTGVDERLEDVLEELPQVFVDRVQLDQRDFPVDEELAEEVEYGDGRDIAGAQDETDVPLG